MKALLLSKFGKGRGAKAVAGEAELRKKFSRIRFARFGRGSRCTVELTSAEAKQLGRALAKLPADIHSHKRGESPYAELEGTHLREAVVGSVRRAAVTLGEDPK